VIELTDLNYYNIPESDTIFDTNSLTVYLNLIQPINDLIYYNKLVNYSIPLDKFEIDTKYEKRSLEECAKLSKNNRWLGIQYCENTLTCYSINDEKLFEELIETKDTNCLAFREEKEEYAKFQLINKYTELKDSIKLIEQNIAERKLNLENGFSFQLLDNLNEINHLDKDELFDLIQEDTCLNDKKLKNLNCKLKSKLSDCIFTCQSSNCNMFSIQLIKQDQFKCCFIEDTFNSFKKKYLKEQPTNNQLNEDDKESYLIRNSKCNLYELSYLNQFSKLTGKTIDSKPLSKFKSNSPENCAIECLKENTESKCLSFSYCIDNDEYVCELRKYNHHVLNDKTKKLIDSHLCSLYSGNLFLI
jgi:hypothetical protein